MASHPHRYLVRGHVANRDDVRPTFGAQFDPRVDRQRQLEELSTQAGFHVEGDRPERPRQKIDEDFGALRAPALTRRGCARADLRNDERCDLADGVNGRIFAALKPQAPVNVVEEVREAHVPSANRRSASLGARRMKMPSRIWYTVHPLRSDSETNPKNGTTIEYRTKDSVSMLNSRSDCSLSGEYHAMRQIFAPPCP